MSVDQTFSRRRLLATSAALALPAPPPELPSRLNVSAPPGAVTLFTENQAIPLTRNGTNWQSSQTELTITTQASESNVTLRAVPEPALRVHLRWPLQMPAALQFLGDDWERSYGTLAWHAMEPERILPWYFLAFDGTTTFAAGVKTGAAAFCFWQIDPAGISLWLDIRNGGRGVQLRNRQLLLASVVSSSYADAKPFAAAKQFCRRLSPHPRLPAQPIYGGNNWYYAYGNSSASNIRDDSHRLSSLATANDNRPFMVIDDGWSPNKTAGPWSRGNARFPDMPQLASDMLAIGVRSGLWLRPLFTKEDVPSGWCLNSRAPHTLDPTVPEALNQIQQDIRTTISWGYELIKHDFSTYDLLGRWGFRMGAELTDPDWSFADPTRTNAEVIRDFYQALRDAAGNTLLLGCNTVGHLSAGLFELQRIGDDTSGRDWDRTRKMGVNTLAFRAPQHNTFFAVDADCVGLTKDIPWIFNRQWLHLIGP